MRFPYYIAKRYLRSKSGQNAVNIINFATFLVIVIGSAALFIVLSGFAGLKAFSLSFSNSFDPDLKAVPTTGKFFTLSETQENQLAQVQGIAAYSKEIEEQVSLSYNQKNHIASLKGIDSTYRLTSGLDSIMYYGEWLPDPKTGIAGIGVANLLGLTINQFSTPLSIIAPKTGKGSLSTQGFNTKPYNELPLVITGVYQLEAQLDQQFVFAHLPLVQALLEKGSRQFSGINFKLEPNSSEKEVRQKLSQVMGTNIALRNRREQNTALFRMLNTENLATYLIFTLVLIIALFNVVGAITMMILDKRQNSKTLFSLGATLADLRQIYFLQGLLVTLFGGGIGVLLGGLLIASQQAFGWLMITPNLPYPVRFQSINIAIVLLTIGVLGAVASKLASSRINRSYLA